MSGPSKLSWLFLIAIAAAAGLWSAPGSALAQENFRRGDANQDGVVDLSDAVYLDAYAASLACSDAADATDDEIVDLRDWDALLGYLFLGEAPPPSPGPLAPGPDPTQVGLSCLDYRPSSPPPIGTVRYYFDGPYDHGGPGKKILDFDVRVSMEDEAAFYALEGWSFSLTADGGTITSISFGSRMGYWVAPEPPVFHVEEAAVHESDPGRKGAVSTVVVGNQERPQGFACQCPLAHITIEVLPPPDGSVAVIPVTLRFEDGFVGRGQPVRNMFTMLGSSQVPQLQPPLTMTITLNDCNGNGQPDREDIDTGASNDCNLNLFPDECDLAWRSTDCNGNGILDECDIQSGTSGDCDGDGWPDECEKRFRRGDANVDGTVDIADAVFICKWFDGIGPEPLCFDAADVNDSAWLGFLDVRGVVDYEDARLAMGFGDTPFPGSITPHVDPSDSSLFFGVPPGVNDGLLCSSYCPAPAPKLADLVLGFEAPRMVTGSPGQLVSFEAFAVLTTSANTTQEGACGWSIGITADGGVIREISQEGIVVVNSSGEWDLRDYSWYGNTWTGVLSWDPYIEGAGAANILHWMPFWNSPTGITLAPEGTARLARFTVEATIPPDGSVHPVTLRYADIDYAIKKNKNTVVLGSSSQTPNLENFTVLFTPVDCNGNGLPDDQDISSGFSSDCNSNAAPDECELTVENDCNHNRIIDGCEIASDSSLDCNSNGIPDACDIASGASTDCNLNGHPDACDLSEGLAPDCNRNHVPDTCDVALETSADCNRNGLPDECDAAEHPLLTFSMRQYDAVTVSAVTAADLDGDGDLDLAAAGNHPGKVYILTNDGSGAFSLSGTIPVSDLYEAVDITAADLNGDGRIDLAVAILNREMDFVPREALAILVNDGGGNFTIVKRENHAGGSTSVTAADLTGDSSIELLTTGFYYVLGFIAIQGGNFTEIFEFPLGGFPRSITSADLDGDGTGKNWAVVLVLDPWNGESGLRIQSKEGGDFSVSPAANSVIAADLDRDGDVDIAVAGGGGSISVVRNEGGGTFREVVNYPAGTGILDVAAADVDGDKSLDLVTVGGQGPNGLGVFFNDGHGVFTAPQEFLPGSGSGIVAADLDGRGEIDLVVAGNPLLVLLNETIANPPDANFNGILDACEKRFRRGDANADGDVNITDPIAILAFLFLGTVTISCPDACDVDGLGTIDITDAIYLLRNLFLGGKEIPAPGPASCGVDLTDDGLPECNYPPERCR